VTGTTQEVMNAEVCVVSREIIGRRDALQMACICLVLGNRRCVFIWS